MVRTVDIILSDDVEVSDFAGPVEVFGVAGTHHGSPVFQIRTMALQPGPVTARNGLSVNPTPVMGAAPIADPVIASGGYGTRRAIHNPAMLAHLRAANAAA